jgi:hypothetical protein
MNTTRALTLFLALVLSALGFLALATPTARAADPVIVRVKVNGATSGTCGTSWDTACGLQYALTMVAISGTELWVAAGTYKPTAGADRLATFQLRDGIALYGGFAGGETLRGQRNFTANVTILSGDIGIPGDSSDNAYHVVNGTGAQSDTILDGFTVTGGRADDVVNGNCIGCGGGGGGMSIYAGNPTLANLIFSGNWAYYGGGIYDNGWCYIGCSSSPTLTNVTFISNTALSGGGGMYNFYSSPMLTNATFSHNSASIGGGMDNSYSSPTLTSVTFSSNSAENGGGLGNEEGSNSTLTNVTFSSNLAIDGGGMYVISSSLTLTNVIFSGNSAINGGGMYNDHSNPTLANVTLSSNSAYAGAGMYSDHSNPTLTNITFSNNFGTVVGGSSGGGMYNYQSSPKLTNVTFSGNSTTNGGDGGGMVNISSSPTLTNVTFSGNSASGYGGGMNNYQSSPVLTNVTFSGNRADTSVGGINNISSSLTIRNTIVWDNWPSPQISNEGGTVSVSYSVVQGGCPAGTTCAHFITADPRLGPFGYWGGATQTIPLLPGSSAIDTGNDAYCPPTDQRGVPRPQGAHCDIGAFEGQLTLLNLPLIGR